MVICSVPRSPLAEGATPRFYIDGHNSSGTSTPCTLFVYTFLNTLRATKSFVLSGSASDVLVEFAPGVIEQYDYVSVYCTLPPNSTGMLRGVTSVQ